MKSKILVSILITMHFLFCVVLGEIVEGIHRLMSAHQLIGAQSGHYLVFSFFLFVYLILGVIVIPRLVFLLERQKEGGIEKTQEQPKEKPVENNQ